MSAENETVFCCVCGAYFHLTGCDGVFLDGAEVAFRENCNGAFCIECAQQIHNAYREALRKGAICEHGVNDGEFCEDCHREWREHLKRYEEQFGGGGS